MEKLAGTDLHRATSACADEPHRQSHILIHSVQLLRRNVGIEHRWESNANRRRIPISGRGQTPTRSDNPVPTPFRHPPVRCRLRPKARSWAHIRAGHPVCGPPLNTLAYATLAFIALVLVALVVFVHHNLNDERGESPKSPHEKDYERTTWFTEPNGPVTKLVKIVKFVIT